LCSGTTVAGRAERETHTHQLEQLAAAATDFTVMQIPTTDRS
jgi:hypothetical protein